MPKTGIFVSLQVRCVCCGGYSWYSQAGSAPVSTTPWCHPPGLVCSLKINVTLLPEAGGSGCRDFSGMLGFARLNSLFSYFTLFYFFFPLKKNQKSNVQNLFPAPV